MKKVFCLCFLLAIGATLFQSCKTSEKISDNRLRSFNEGWKFIRDSINRAEDPAYDDSGWRNLDLPHDWSIEDLPGQPSEDQIGPFSRESPGGFAMGYLIGGEGWYRKHFTIDKNDQGKRIMILFDGVMLESDVWLNGINLGHHAYGYTPFSYDLTPYINPVGQSNVLAVRVRNKGRTARWYNGSGIYRDVSLIITDQVHIALNGIYVTTPEVSEEMARVNLSINVINNREDDADVNIVTRLTSADGKEAGQAEQSEIIRSGSNKEITQTIKVNIPQLWSPDSPSLYKVEVSLLSNGKLLDADNITIGIRSIDYNAQEGLLINGKPVKLRGGCVHHDNGILGAAAFSRAEERKVEIMKANGFNAIRTSHNPPSARFLDACDRLGVLVIDEAFDKWAADISQPDGYFKVFEKYWQQDLKYMILRDRNHPSVIMWSIGNEIPAWNDTSAMEVRRKLSDAVRALDPTRPVTEAIAGAVWTKKSPAFDQLDEMLDIVGYNYDWRPMPQSHTLYPERLMMTTESHPFDMYSIWQQIEKSPWIIGDFVWTGMDYLGESGVGYEKTENEKEKVDLLPEADADLIKSIGQYSDLFLQFGRRWPWFNAYCGDIDIIGNKKPQSYYRDVVWNRSEMEIAVHTPMLPDTRYLLSLWGWPDELACWTWPGEEGKTLKVSIYTHCTSVRLELNGKVIGEQKTASDTKTDRSVFQMSLIDLPLRAVFEVPYSPGELKAIGLTDGKEVVTKVLKSAGEPDKIVLTPDRYTIAADRNDLAYVTVEIADKKGNIIPNADLNVNLAISGNGELIAAGNGSPDQMTSFRQPHCRLNNGKALVILRPFARSGNISLSASSDGLSPASIEIEVK